MVHNGTRLLPSYGPIPPLVLSGGGITGFLFEIGVLAALARTDAERNCSEPLDSVPGYRA
jgi:hypothetical protein